MLPLGVVSVTFRALSPREIVDLCVSSGLECIEWGGDVHVPPGDVARAREVGQVTRDAGISVLCYGSYYRCDGSDFSPILESALELGASRIRVWAGQSESSDGFERVLEDLTRVSALAQAQGGEIVLEFHGGTLTHQGQSARRLLNAGQSHFASLWQPLRRIVGDEQIEENVAELRQVVPFLRHVHVYEWHETQNGKVSLSLHGSKQWPRYIQELRTLGLEVPLLLEFVPEDAPEVLRREATALRAMCVSGGG